VFLVVLAPVTLGLAWWQTVNPSLSVAIFTQNGVYALFAATFAPVLFGMFGRGAHRGFAFAAAAVALVVHFGMYYGGVTHYHNNPAVPATCALAASVLVMVVGVLVNRPGPPTAGP
jgi:SSS family solute:Na+ symporter/sodium/pantothenate symporter